MSTALLATVAGLPDLVDDVPKAPELVAELIGHFMAKVRNLSVKFGVSLMWTSGLSWWCIEGCWC